MAIIDTGLGFTADENYLKQYAGAVANVHTLSSSTLPELPVASTQSDIFARGILVYTTRISTREYEHYAAASVPGCRIYMLDTALTMYGLSADNTAILYTVRRERALPAGDWEYRDNLSASNISTSVTGHAGMYRATKSWGTYSGYTYDVNVPRYTLANGANQCTITDQSINKANDGYSVVAWVKYKWSGGYGDVEETPILISTSIPATEFGSLPTGAVAHYTNVYYQGAIFRMGEIYNLVGATPGSILTLNYSGSSYGELSETELFELIARAASIKVPVAPDPYRGESGQGGGTGGGIGTGSPVGHPTAPTLSASDTGLVTLYVPTLSELQALSSYLWSGLFDINTFRKIFADPMDAILGLSILPVAVPAGSSVPIRIGNQDASVSAARALGQYVTVSCGSLTIPDNIGCYLDRDPFTQLSLYLPYIGFVPLRADDCMGKALSLQYIIDIFSGACVASLTADGSVVGSWAGNCATQIPITSANYNNVISGALSIAATAATLAGGASAVAPLAVASMANTAINAQKPVISRSGSMSGSAGLMGVQTPYIIATQPRPAIPGGQNQEIGYPSYINELLGNLMGYTIIDEIHLSGISGTQAELQEIQELLAGGVIL